MSAWVALYLARRQLRAITGPLRSLAEVAHAARSRRALDRRVPPAAIAELDNLANDFNALLDELESWQTHLQSENETLAHQASHDSLTGLPNRAFFEGRLIRALRNASKLNEQVAVLYLDSDRFKGINDNFGHAAGDAVLTAVATRVRAQLREDDLVARLGGDEFAVLLAPLHKAEDAERIAEKIIASMEMPIQLPGNASVLTSSVSALPFTPMMVRHRAPFSMPPMRRCTKPNASPEAVNIRRSRITPSLIFKPGADSCVHILHFPCAGSRRFCCWPSWP